MPRKLKWTAALKHNGISQSIVQDVHGEATVTNDLLEDSLRQLNLLRKQESIEEYEDVSLWQRGGAETYIAVGALTVQGPQGREIRDFIAKAAVTFPTRPEDSVNECRRRLSLLLALGIPGPTIYSSLKAVLYQEFLPIAFGPYWQSADEGERKSLRKQLADIAAVIDACGFRPLSFTYDLMMRRNTICIVDVGADLGPWHFSTPRETAYEQLKQSQFIVSDLIPEFRSRYRIRYGRTREAIQQLPEEYS